MAITPTVDDEAATQLGVGTIDSSYRVDALRVGALDGLAVTLSGAARTASILALLDALDDANPAFVLIDESELKVSLIGPSDIQRIAQRWSRADALRGAAIAVVAPNKVVYGMNRMFQLVSNADTRLAVFWTRQAAVAWVGELGARAGLTRVSPARAPSSPT
ncbi:MAG TPA: hypothetical protein VIN37_06485, partial [Candidatus Limnocylindria bacterium]